MSFTKNPGRIAGLLYLLASIPGVFALIYVPSKLIVHRNATATAHNIAASETLFRLGIAADLICQAGFLSSWPWLCTVCSRASTSGTPRSW
jgi:hypothetical protein